MTGATATLSPARDDPATRFPVRCALCGLDLYRWYWGGYTPRCANCARKEGPVIHPDRWHMNQYHVSPLAWEIWQNYAKAALEREEQGQ